MYCMNQHLQIELALLNRKGRFLRSLLHDFNDNDLKRFTPSPSTAKVNELLEKANKLYLAAVQRN